MGALSAEAGAQIGAQFGANVGTGVIGNAFGILNSYLYNKWAKEREESARQQNYQYNELAAQNADARTRALYADLYSPQAQLQQIKEAGLSPSLFYGQAGGISGQTGAQGAGSAGIAPQTHGIQTFGMNPVDIANLQLVQAQKNNIDADTDLKKSQTGKTLTEDEILQFEKTIKELESKLKERENSKDYIDFTISTSYIIDRNTGEKTSIFELAQQKNSFNEFMNQIRADIENTDNDYSKKIKEVIATEQGHKSLRQIYFDAKEFSTDIKILSTGETNAEFQKSVLDALNSIDYANLNANAVKEQFNAQVETNKLTSNQKGAWNRLINKLGEGEWYTDVIIALAMIFGNFATGNNIRLNTGDNYVTVQKKE